MKTRIGMPSGIGSLVLAITVITLLFAVIAKVLTLIENPITLKTSDPVFPILTTYHATLLAIILEVGVLGALSAGVIKHREVVGWAALLGLTLCFLVYRIAAYNFGYSGSCNCLGTPGKWILRDSRQQFVAGWAILGFWGVSSVYNCWSYRRLVKLAAPARTVTLLAILFLSNITKSYAAASSTARPMQISGTISASDFGRDGSLITNYLAQFNLIKASTAWGMVLTYPTGAKSHLYFTNGLCFDSLQEPGLVEVPNPLTVTSNSYPLMAGWYVTMPWLAFCSNDYFAGHRKADLPLPWLFAMAAADAHICESDVEYLDEGNHSLPSKVKYTTNLRRLVAASTNPLLRTESVEGSERISRMIRYDQVYPANLEMGAYAVLASTNLLGKTIPTSFELIRYSYLIPKSGAAPNLGNLLSNRWVSSKYVGEVTACAVSVEDLKVPEFTNNLSVVDYRMKDADLNVDFVRYNTMTGSLPLEVPASALSEWDLKRRNAIKQRRVALVKRAGVVTLMGLLLLLPVIILARSRSRTAMQ